MEIEKINYAPIGWDTTKSLGPTNFNQMDRGIKDACDAADELKESLLRRTREATAIEGTASFAYLVDSDGNYSFSLGELILVENTLALGTFTVNSGLYIVKSFYNGDRSYRACVVSGNSRTTGYVDLYDNVSMSLPSYVTQSQTATTTRAGIMSSASYNSLFAMPGTTERIDGFYGGMNYISSGKKICFTVPTKNLSNISTISVAINGIYVRTCPLPTSTTTTGVYILGSETSAAKSGWSSISAIKSGLNAVAITLNFTTAPKAAYNDYPCVGLASVTLTYS